jgi:hypothetical protein
MWILTSLSTAAGATKLPWWRREKAEQVERRVPLQQQLALEDRMARLEHQMEVLDGQYRTLRGYVYVKKGLVGPAGEAPPGEANIPQQPQSAASSKEELRRSLVQSGRFIPGQAPKHE